MSNADYSDAPFDPEERRELRRMNFEHKMAREMRERRNEDWKSRGIWVSMAVGIIGIFTLFRDWLVALFTFWPKGH
jgi:hypothetical protein